MTANTAKESGQQINDGSGKAGSEETTADAGEPLSLSLQTTSYIEVPLEPR